MFKDLRSPSSSSNKKSQPAASSGGSTGGSPERPKAKSTLKSTLSGVTSSISGISAASWMSAATAAAPPSATPTPTNGNGSSATSSSSVSGLSFAVGSNLLSSALSTSSSTLNAIVNKNLTGKDLLDWALSGANNMASTTTSILSTDTSIATTAADTTHATAVQQLQRAERLRRKCLEHWQVLVNATQRAAIKVQIILTKLQGMVETFQILMSDYLKKLVVFECSAVANQQYDLQMLFKVFETVNIEGDLTEFMSQNNTSFRPSEYPTLSEIISTVTPPSQLPPPPCATLLACPVTKTAPYIMDKEKLFALRLPLLVRPVDQSPSLSPTENLSSQLTVELVVAETGKIPSASSSTVVGSSSYGQAEDVLRSLIELSNSLRKQKDSSSRPTNTTKHNNNPNNNSNTIASATSALDPVQSPLLSLAPPSPLPPSSSTSTDNIPKASLGGIKGSAVIPIVEAVHVRNISVRLEETDNNSTISTITTHSAPTVINPSENNNVVDESDVQLLCHQSNNLLLPSDLETQFIAVNEIPLSSGDDDADDNEGEEGEEVVEEEEMNADPEREESDPLWTLPSKSSVMGKEHLIPYLQPQVFSDAKLLQAIALPRNSSPSTTRSLGNLDCIDEEIKDQDDVVDGDDVT